MTSRLEWKSIVTKIANYTHNNTSKGACSNNQARDIKRITLLYQVRVLSNDIRKVAGVNLMIEILARCKCKKLKDLCPVVNCK